MDKTASKYAKAYEAGRRARRRNCHRVLANPSDFNERCSWLKGWDDEDAQMKPKTSSLKEQIESLRNLKRNWDSYGAEPISEKTIQLSCLVAERIKDLGITIAVPVCDGSIALCDADEMIVVSVSADE